MSEAASAAASSRSEQCVAVADWIRRRTRQCLLVTHERPDGDALGCLIGLQNALHRQGFNSLAYLSSPLPARYRQLFPNVPGVSIANIPDDHTFDGIICLDCANWQRVDLPAPWQEQHRHLPICNIDHHPDNGRYGEISWIDPDSAATTAMLTELLQVMHIEIPPESATCFLTGLITDCGAFRFRNSNAATYRTAANLLDAGADNYRIMDTLFAREPYSRLLLKARLVEKAQFAFQNRLVYAVLTPELRDQCGVAPEDTEDVIDAIRIAESAEIACLLQPEDAGVVRFSLRSRSPQYPVGPLARQLGGGGHDMAAGARCAPMTIEQAIQKLLELTGKILPHDD